MLAQGTDRVATPIPGRENLISIAGHAQRQKGETMPYFEVQVPITKVYQIQAESAEAAMNWLAEDTFYPDAAETVFSDRDDWEADEIPASAITNLANDD